MKSTCDVISGLAKLVQDQVAQGGSAFVSSESREGSLVITAKANDGVRRQFSVAVTALYNDAPPPAEETAPSTEAGTAEGASECPGKADAPCDGDSTDEACDEMAPTDASSDQAETPQSETTEDARDDPAAATSAVG